LDAFCGVVRLSSERGQLQVLAAGEVRELGSEQQRTVLALLIAVCDGKDHPGAWVLACRG
jgi:hypothetical protein